MKNKYSDKEILDIFEKCEDDYLLNSRFIIQTRSSFENDSEPLITNKLGYKEDLTEFLETETDTRYDIMKVYELVNNELILVWEREELLSKKEFMQKYEEVFDNNVDWSEDNIPKYHLICYRSDNFISVDDHIGSYILAGARYTEDVVRAIDFQRKYEKEIKKYLFNIEEE